MAEAEWWIDEDGDYLCICEGEPNEFGEREEVAMLHTNRPSLKASQYENARLIAAAPNLLKALRAVRSEVELLRQWRELDGTLIDQTIESDLLMNVDKAINKAEGGAR
jgi:hypothetical protein